MKDEKSMKFNVSITLKVVLGLVIFSLLGLLLYKWYTNGKLEKIKTPVIASVLTSEVKSQELFSYLSENDPTVMYFSKSDDKKCREIEASIKDFFVSHSFEDVVVYMNLYGMDTPSFFQKLKEYYHYEEEIGLPVFIYFEGGKIQNVLSGDVTMERVEDFFREIGMIL